MSYLISDNELKELITAGVAAPSGGNIQPWKVDNQKNSLTIKLDSSKLGTLLDVNNYGSIFALGSFACNLSIKADSLGIKHTTSITQPTDADKISVSIAFSEKKSPTNKKLANAIKKRATNRQLSNGKLISNSNIATLKKIASENDATILHTITTNEEKKLAANILGKADVIRTKNMPLFTEMMSEIRWNDAEAKKTKDGIDIKTMELPGNVSKMLKLLSNHPNLTKTIPSKALEKQAEPLLINCSHLCMLCLTKEVTPQSVFQAGYDMQKLWLHATTKKIAIHPWTIHSFLTLRTKHFPNTGLKSSEQKTLLEEDKKLRVLFNIPTEHTPVFIFRLSHADQPSALSLRKNWQQFID